VVRARFQDPKKGFIELVSPKSLPEYGRYDGSGLVDFLVIKDK
jgi:hypothetical protein